MLRKVREIFFLLIFSISLVNFSFSQNLVPNPSFEIYDTCPNNAGQVYHAIPWENPTLASPDYYNTCNSGYWSTPNNVYGSELAKSGISYAGLFTYLSPSIDYREYIQILLNDSLISNQKYCVKFYVSLADSSLYSSNDFGAYLSTNQINNLSSQQNFLFVPQINNTPANSLNNKNGWVLVIDSFVASGGEKYITIGNFHDDINSSVQFVGNGASWQTGAYYYIDDVSVLLCDTATILNELERQTFIAYPNPFHSYITVQLSDFSTGEFLILTAMGKILRRGKVDSKEVQIDRQNLQEGVYYLRITTNKTSNTIKIIIN